ncbi:hypothetical protein ACIO6T_22055 [Streptomyces sp. NPDC087532]|uniref:hypothetical protein n=1 Tax=unclassified Streptomyces TaxID=2593676 RepID=UPI003333A242
MYKLLSGSGEDLAGTGLPRGFRYHGGVLAALVDRADEDRQALAGAGVHPRLAPLPHFVVSVSIRSCSSSRRLLALATRLRRSGGHGRAAILA